MKKVNSLIEDATLSRHFVLKFVHEIREKFVHEFVHEFMPEDYVFRKRIDIQYVDIIKGSILIEVILQAVC